MTEEKQQKENYDYQYKLVLIGDGGTGKTTFVKRHESKEFDDNYIPTIGVKIHPIIFYTNKGNVQFLIWDTTGQEKLGGLRDGYYIQSDAAIIFFDVTSYTSYKNVKNWYTDFSHICENIPIVLVGNKVDLKDRKVKPKMIKFHHKNNIEYYDISAKSNYNYEKPFLYLIRRLLNDPDIQIINPTPIKPPEVEIDPSITLIYESELKELSLEKLEPNLEDDL